MVPYWLAFAWYSFGALNSPVISRGAVRPAPLLLASVVILTLFVGLRFDVGADWINYVDMLAFAKTMSLGELLVFSDPGYMVLNGLTGFLGLDIWFVNLVCAAIFVWGLTKFAQAEPNPWLVVAVAIPYLVIVVAMGYTRQSVAIGMILAAIPAFNRAQYGRFLLYFAIAATFHKTAIVVLPLIALAAVRHRFAIYLAAGVAAILLFTLFLQNFIDAFLIVYIDQAMTSDGAGVRVAMNIVPALIVLLFLRRFTVSEQERALWRNFAFASLAMLALLLVVTSSTLVDRVALYLMPIQLFALGRLPLAFPQGTKPNTQLMFAVLAYSALIQWVWLSFASHAEYWLPYRTIFNQGGLA